MLIFLVKIYVRLIPLQSESVLGFTNLPSVLCGVAGIGRERGGSSALRPGPRRSEGDRRCADTRSDLVPVVARAPVSVNKPLRLL